MNGCIDQMLEAIRRLQVEATGANVHKAAQLATSLMGRVDLFDSCDCVQVLGCQSCMAELERAAEFLRKK